MPNDSELVIQAKRGNQLAFRQLVRRHEQQVRSTVLGMIGDVQEVDDIAQEVFIRFYQSIEKFRGEAKLSTYLSRIAINLSLNELKRRQRKQRWVTFFQKGDKTAEIEDLSADPGRMENRELVQRALQQLEPMYRSVVLLRMIEGYSVKETTEILNLPAGTIASRLTRGQKKLKEILMNWNVIE